MGADNSIWLMNADGGDQRTIVASPGQSGYINSLRWSPTGDRLSYTASRWDNNANFVSTLVVDIRGTVVAEYAGLVDAIWSPDGDRLSAIRTLNEGGQYYGAPVVLNLATGAEIAVGPAVEPGTIAPAWSPDGLSLTHVCLSGYIGQPDGSTIVDPQHGCDGDGLRITAADGSGSRILVPMDYQAGFFLGNPSWSPSGATIAVYSIQEGSGCRGYMLVDAASGDTAGCVSLPPQAGHVGGGCGGGGPAMDASHWTADGSRFIFTAQGTGQSGIFVHDLNTGGRTVVPSNYSMSISLAANRDDLTFAAGGHIWVAGLDGSNVTLLGEGHSPAWQPLH
jgi:Tol biopolymer transport system component